MERKAALCIVIELQKMIELQKIIRLCEIYIFINEINMGIVALSNTPTRTNSPYNNCANK